MKKKTKKPEPVTIQDIYDSLERSKFGDKKRPGILLRPIHPSVSFAELDYDLVKNALDEIMKKIPQVQAQLDEFTNCEKLTLTLLKLHAEHG